ncbi:MAG: hypothetical protein E6I22_05825 [Chloroflexi bacterium]|nr:MAG: hypothetical protein E6I22_05825 [Chloroflexota bacterium]
MLTPSQTRRQTTDEDGPRPASTQRLRGPLDRLSKAECFRRLQQGRAADQRKDLPTQERSQDGGRRHPGQHWKGIRIIARDCNPGQQQQQVTRREWDGHADLLDEDQSADGGHQQVAAQVLEGSEWIHKDARARAGLG